MDRSFEGKAPGFARSRRSWLFFLAIAFAVLGFLPAVFAPFQPDHAVAGIAAFFGYLGALLGLTIAWSRWWRHEHGALRADESGVSLDGRRLIARSSIRHGHLIDVGGRTFVRLLRKGRMQRFVDVAVADDAEGRALLRAMRLDDASSVSEHTLGYGTYRAGILSIIAAPLIALAAFVGLGSLGISLHSIGLLLASMGALLLLLPGHAFTTARQVVTLSIGADGVRIRRGLGRARFLPFSQIAGATTDGRDIELRTTAGERITVHHGNGKGWSSKLDANAGEGRRIVERIEARLASGPAHDVPITAELARAGRKVEEWLEAAAAAVDTRASFRTQAVPHENLWEIVYDAAAPPTVRVGAAVALRASLDDEGRAKMRVVADSCAAPRIRVALETIASGDDLALHAALEPLADEGHEQLRRASR